MLSTRWAYSTSSRAMGARPMASYKDSGSASRPMVRLSSSTTIGSPAGNRSRATASAFSKVTGGGCGVGKAPKADPRWLARASRSTCAGAFRTTSVFPVPVRPPTRTNRRCALDSSITSRPKRRSALTPPATRGSSMPASASQVWAISERRPPRQQVITASGCAAAKSCQAATRDALTSSPTRRCPRATAASRPRALYSLPTASRSSSASSGRFTAPGTRPRANSTGERTSIRGRSRRSMSA